MRLAVKGGNSECALRIPVGDCCWVRHDFGGRGKLDCCGCPVQRHGIRDGHGDGVRCYNGGISFSCNRHGHFRYEIIVGICRDILFFRT